MKKTLHYKKIFILIILIVLLGFAHNTEAIKRAVFPDGKNLQPMPKDAYPNVSGNINSKVDPTFTEIPKKEVSSKDIDNKEVVSKEEIINKNKYSYWYFIGSIILILFFVLYYKKRKLK